MKTFRNALFSPKTRNYECTNIVVIRAERLPKDYDPAVWLETDESATRGFTYLGAIHQNGERHEQYGYL